jgi:hypothetical protein
MVIKREDASKGTLSSKVCMPPPANAIVPKANALMAAVTPNISPFVFTVARSVNKITRAAYETARVIEIGRMRHHSRIIVGAAALATISTAVAKRLQFAIARIE